MGLKASDVKGYVVRGKNAGGNDVCSYGPGVGIGPSRQEPRPSFYTSPDAANGVRGWAAANGFHDVHVYVVAKDGTETPLPTYAEALDEVGQLCAEVNLARGRTMAALAEAARLRAEVAAWVRLVKAERAHHDQTDLLGERDDDMKGAWGEVDAALQALRDLGVDVAVLLKLQEAEEGRAR